MRYYIIITLVFIGVLGGGFYLKEVASKPKDSTSSINTAPPLVTSPSPSSTTIATPIETTPTIPVVQETTKVSTKTQSVTAPKTTPTKTPPPTNPATSPTVPSCGKGGSCTSAQVATHNSREDCWVSMGALQKVYNITEYVSNGDLHPGGDIIAPYCGEDIYDLFMGNTGYHAHSSKALNKVLTPYFIGELTQ